MVGVIAIGGIARTVGAREIGSGGLLPRTIRISQMRPPQLARSRAPPIPWTCLLPERMVRFIALGGIARAIGRGGFQPTRVSLKRPLQSLRSRANLIPWTCLLPARMVGFIPHGGIARMIGRGGSHSQWPL